MGTRAICCAVAVCAALLGCQSVSPRGSELITVNGITLLENVIGSASADRVIIGNDYNPCRPAFDAPQSSLPSES